MKKSSLEKKVLLIGASLLLIGCFAAVTHAATAITTLQTVSNDAALNDQVATLATTTANLTTGVNDQTFTLGTTTANATQTKASRTLTVGSLPASLASTTIGLCVVTYSSATSTDNLNCSGNAAVISLTLHGTAASLALALGSLTGLTDTGHGALTATSSGTTATFATSGTEGSSTPISFTDHTSGVVTSTGSTTGIPAVAEVLTATTGGTIEVGDIYTLGTASGTISYTLVASDTSQTNIDLDVNTALQATSTYSSQFFTSVASSTAGDIIFTAKTPGTSFFLTSNAINHSAAAEILTVTVGGTPEIGDIYNLTIPTGLISYTTVASDTSQKNIAIDFEGALLASSTYSGQPFTASVSSSTITITAKTPGTGFFLAGNALNGSPVAQVVTFTVPSVSSNTTYGIILNGTTYSYTGSATSDIVTGLTSALSSNPVATCTAASPIITCTAKTPGTAFTYSTSAVDVVVSTNTGNGTGGGTEGGGGGGSFNVTPTITTTPISATTTTVTSPIVTPPMTGGASKIKESLKYLLRNNSVKELQTLFSADPNLHYTSGVTGYFGLKTLAAVELFQTTYGVVTYLDPGYGMVGPKTRAALIRVYGN